MQLKIRNTMKNTDFHASKTPIQEIFADLKSLPLSLRQFFSTFTYPERQRVMAL